MRCEQAGLGQRHLTLLGGLGCDVGDRGGDLGAQIGHRVEIDVQVATNTLLGQGNDPPQPARAAAEELRDRVGAPQIQVRIVFPGDADTTQHLDAVLGVGLRGLDTHRRRQCGGQRQLRILGPTRRIRRGPGRVRGGDRGLLGAQKHLGAHVLDGLEAADRLAELLTDLRVLRGGLQAPPGQAGGLGGEHRDGQVDDPLRGHGEFLGGGAVSHHPRQRAGEVGGRQRFHGDAVGGRVDQHPRVPGRQQHHTTGRPAQDVLGRARHPPVGVGEVGGQGHTCGALPGGQRFQQFGV